VQPRRFLERWVASRRFDLGLGALPVHHSGIQTEKIYSVPVVAVMHPNHPLAARKSVRVEELANEKFITMTPNTLLGQQVAEILDQVGIKPRSAIQASQALLCCNFVAQGLGIAITDAMVPMGFGSLVKMVPIEPQIHMDFGLLYPLGVKHSKEAQQLAEIIKSTAKSCIGSLKYQ
jgi:DNA-binding transcriptional LysR family regulator